MPDPATHDRIAKLVADNPVLLFMKGTPLFPQCGFSSRAIAMLDRLGVGYETVDVLQDLEVRQGIKEFSDWPPIPQPYQSEARRVGKECVSKCRSRVSPYHSIKQYIIPITAQKL